MKKMYLVLMKIRNGWCTVDVSRLQKRKQINLRKEFNLLVSKTTRATKFFILELPLNRKKILMYFYIFIIGKTVKSSQERIKFKN